MCSYECVSECISVNIFRKCVSNLLLVHSYHPSVILLRGAPLNIVIANGTGHQVFCSNKGRNWQFIFPWKKINWHVLQIVKAHFSYSIRLMISEKSIMLWFTYFFTMVVHACTRASAKKTYKKNCIPGFPILLAVITSCVLVIFIDTNTHKLTEKRNFKTFSKENYAVGLDSFTCLILNVELNIILIVLMDRWSL